MHAGTVVHSHNQVGTCMRTTCNTHRLAHLYTATTEASRYMHAYNMQHTQAGTLVHSHKQARRYMHAYNMCVLHVVRMHVPACLWLCTSVPVCVCCMLYACMYMLACGCMCTGVPACTQHKQAGTCMRTTCNTHTCLHTSTQPQASRYMHAYNMQHTQTGTLVHSHKQACACMRYNMQHTQTGTLVHSHKQAGTSHAYNMQHTHAGTLVHSHKQACTCMRTTCNTHRLAH